MANQSQVWKITLSLYTILFQFSNSSNLDQIKRYLYLLIKVNIKQEIFCKNVWPQNTVRNLQLILPSFSFSLYLQNVEQM